MQLLTRAIACITLFSSVSTLLAQEAVLPERITQRIDKGLEAYRGGYLAETLRQLQPVLESLNDEQLEAAEKHILVTHRLGLTIPELVTQARVELVIAGNGRRLPRAGAAELPFALVALDKRLAELIADAKANIDEPVPALGDGADLEDRMSLIPSLLTQLGQADQIVEHMEKLTARLRPAALKDFPDAAKAIATRDFAAEHQLVAGLHEQLINRLVDLSLVRLNNAAGVLQNQSADFEERFAAGERAQESAAALQRYWPQYRKSMKRAGKFDPASEVRWRNQARAVELQARPLLVKIYHFSEAKKWWLRGRFGLGPLVDGLAKAVNVNTSQGSPRKEQALVGLLYYPLYMPNPIPKPLEPVANPVGCNYPRRHLAWWQIETRLGATDTPSVVQNRAARLITGTPNLPTQVIGRGEVLALMVPDAPGAVRLPWRGVELVPEDFRLGWIVGYLEYLAALYHFEQLLAVATPAEQQAIDKMIGDDDRFVIYSNLSRKYDNVDPNTTLRLASPTNDPRAEEPYERRGLAWVMALARVEVGAMRAGQTGESLSEVRRADYALRTGKPELLTDFAGPFEKFPPTALERSAFLDILWDGAREHYYQFREVPAEGRQVIRRWPTRRELMQLERKLALAIEMVASFKHYAGGMLVPAQHAELSNWISELSMKYLVVRRALEPPLPVQRVIQQPDTEPADDANTDNPEQPAQPR